MTVTSEEFLKLQADALGRWAGYYAMQNPAQPLYDKFAEAARQYFDAFKSRYSNLEARLYEMGVSETEDVSGNEMIEEINRLLCAERELTSMALDRFCELMFQVESTVPRFLQRIAASEPAGPEAAP